MGDGAGQGLVWTPPNRTILGRITDQGTGEGLDGVTVVFSDGVSTETVGVACTPAGCAGVSTLIGSVSSLNGVIVSTTGAGSVAAGVGVGVASSPPHAASKTSTMLSTPTLAPIRHFAAQTAAVRVLQEHSFTG